ncbi:2-dehydropantoate 2-reductase [Polaromonas sp. OV174]|uniref:ketopantoate reductase family protein n=1 Tax=Polaromonas sp. OV174 TaxID=1855300 RepID=UPI0008E87D27|nr:2-dehydropantoate 2-reductase [Polaromonas sp. OV174]SFC48290.1 2-dehydropantoate 2-reductase [Polaromonas sp. OV174]
MSLRILVIGAGAIGGYVGGLLARAGHEVTFGVRGSALQAITNNGIQLLGPRGDWRITNVMATDAAAFERGEQAMPELVLSCVKLYDAESSAQQWRSALEAAGAVISLQNGIDGVQRIRRGAPGARVYGGLAYIAGRLEAPGVVRYLSDMSSITFGGDDAATHPLLQAFAASINATSGADALQAHLVQDIGSAQWAKFTVLATNAALTCLTRQPAGVVYHDADLLALAQASIAEVMAVGRAEGAVFVPTQAQDTLAILQGFPAELYASMHHDLMAGRPLELDGISGLVARLGRQHAIATPFHSMAYACLKPYLQGGLAGKI